MVGNSPFLGDMLVFWGVFHGPKWQMFFKAGLKRYIFAEEVTIVMYIFYFTEQVMIVMLVVTTLGGGHRKSI